MQILRRNMDKSDRPMLKPELEPLDWLLEVLTLVGLMFFLGYFLYHYRKLPDIIPSHFSASGNPNEFSTKSSLWFLPGMAFFIYALLTIIALIPHQFNYIVKITPENALRQYTMAVRLIRYLKMVLTGLFFYICFSTVRFSMKASSGLGMWFLPLFLTLILIPLFLYMIVSLRKK